MLTRASLLSLLSLPLLLPSAPLAEVKDGHFRAADFPKVAAMVQAFEQRMTSPRVADRERLLSSIAHNWVLPDDELVRFFKRVAKHDPDPYIRGYAIKTLYGVWIPLTPDELPPTFDGYYQGHRVDRTGKDATVTIVAELKQGNVTGGYSAYVAGLLRIKETAPALRDLAEDKNVFVRYSAGRALIEVGDRAAGAAILRTIMGHNVPKDSTIDKVEDPYYITLASRALMEIGPAERREGLERLVKLMEEMEGWGDINAAGRLESVRAALGHVSNKYFVTAREARAWLAQQR